MKRSLFRVGAALATLALAGTLASCSAGSSSSTSKTGTSTSTSASEGAAPGEDAGFEEQPLGDDVHVGPLVVGGVYFQPVDMEPTMGVPAAEASMHMEADIHAAADNKLGYGAGDFVPALTVTYTIKDKVTGIETNIEKKVNGVDCKAGEINDIPAWIDKDLKIQSPPKYYYAMAAQDLYHNHLKADGTYDGVEPQEGDDRHWGSATPNPVFNTIPNRNEACWYAAKGDAHWATITRVMDGHLWHINGIWLKKKAKIMADEGITKEQMESGYPKDNPEDKRDFYIGGAGIGGSVSSAPLLNTSDYFFLPVRYEKIAGGLYSFAPDGGYWAGGIYEGSVTWAHIIFFSSSEIKAVSTDPLEFNSVPAYYARQFE